MQAKKDGCRAPVISLLKEQLLKEQHPHKVDPPEDNTRGNRHKDADHETDKTALLQPGGPSHNDLGDPVDTGDQKEKKLVLRQ